VKLPQTKAVLLITIIIGAALFGSSFAFQPYSTDPKYLSQLREQLGKLNTEIEALQASGSQLEQEAKLLAEQITDSENRIAALGFEISDIRQRLTAIETEIQQLQNQLSSINSQILTKKTELGVAEEQVRKLDTELTKAISQIQELQIKLDQQRSVLAQYEASMESAYSTMISLQNQCNEKITAYNQRVDAFNQKVAEYNSRMEALKAKLWQFILTVGIALLIAAVATYFSGGTLTLDAIATVFSIMSSFGISPPGDILSEYNELVQLQRWIETERSYLESQLQQINILKTELSQATQTYEHWKSMVENQRLQIQETEGTLNYWLKVKSQLEIDLEAARRKASQLTVELNSLESLRAQLESSLNADLGEKQQLQASLAQREQELSALQASTANAKQRKSKAEAELNEIEKALPPLQERARSLNDEITLITVWPFLRWGGAVLTMIALVGVVGLGRKRGPKKPNEGSSTIVV